MSVDDIKRDLDRAKTLMTQGRAGFEGAAETGERGTALAFATVSDSADGEVMKAAAALKAADDEVVRVLTRVEAALGLADAYRKAL
ncbi:hypothetical protein O7632_05740 [Solwaraspora sp. WMMD406]|uniref:hypothetical protein n=1 Tax=Solwaraspora sp. WMMD406 TaxID=3016095 RepID=UPI0024168318|nr:hypothetical protein [Solwaraspora sp. WMMD406]MDG4763615.1 hypothetical protein [Solwaraspora sp. WMMD406]